MASEICMMCRPFLRTTGFHPDCMWHGTKAQERNTRPTPAPTCPHDCYPGRPGDCDGSCQHPEPAPAATDTGLETGLWAMTDVNGKPTNVTTSVNDAKVWLELGYILTEYVTRSQAEKLLAAKDILLDIAKQWARDQEDRANRLQADNAAKDARIEEYETGLVDFHREMSTLEAKLAAAEKALETADTAVTLADKLIERGYGSDTPREWHKVIVAAQKARAVLGGKP